MDVTNTNITIRGSAFNMSAVANFIDNLDKVEAFGEPQLLDATQRKGRGIRTEVYDFRLTFSYTFKKVEPAADATPGTAPATPPEAPPATTPVDQD
jgi:Tfp pilus assembly protein PilN